VQLILKEIRLIFISVKQETKKAAKRFFKKALQSIHVSKPRVITVDKNLAYPIAVEELRKEKTCHQACNSDKRSI
jgi:transposase-like protein